MENVADVRQRFVVYVMASGTEIRTVPKMTRPTRFSKLPSRLGGKDVTIVELW